MLGGGWGHRFSDGDGSKFTAYTTTHSSTIAPNSSAPHILTYYYETVFMIANTIEKKKAEAGFGCGHLADILVIIAH